MKPLLPDALWTSLQRLLPPPNGRRYRWPGRKPLDDRKILTGILFVLKTGIAWEALPAELGCGCGKTCRRHLQYWQQTGVWKRLQHVLQARLPEADQLDWSRALTEAPARKPTAKKEPRNGRRTVCRVVERTFCWLHHNGRAGPCADQVSGQPESLPENVQGLAGESA
jgi:transposase